ncbi:type III-B CRISPR module RAMP protein Cmr6 [Fusobacterium sp. HC1336]|uniref:type III-B CRISPR module RAMP protein Cmr6 n=1 Tax=Fusobacterium sp. HC1336 TaxID=3171169 RepID=UPI003F28049A
MEKYDKNLGYYYLKQRFESYYFNEKLLKEMDRNFFDVSVIKDDEDELEANLNLQKIYFSVAHPGLLIGTGTRIEFSPIQDKESVVFDNYKIGINFDYTTGLPYVPGSSIKGVLRNFFPNIDENEREDVSKAKTEIINIILNKNFSVQELKKVAMSIFEGVKTTSSKEFLPVSKRDKFIEGRILVLNKNKTTVIAKDYLAPHKEVLKDPVPLEILKIAPEIKLELVFQLHDTEIDGLKINKEEKLNLFREILFLTGVGSKTNTGYGHFNREESERLSQEKESIIKKKLEALEKKKAEEEKEKLLKEREKMAPLDRWRLEFEEKSSEEKKKEWEDDINLFENKEDKKIIAKIYLDFFNSEKPISKKSKEKIKKLQAILEK